MGILDRLSYGNSREIPRNWAMTSLDAASVALRNQSSRLTLESQSSSASLTVDRMLEDHSFDSKDISNAVAPVSSTAFSSHSDAPPPSPQEKNRKR